MAERPRKGPYYSLISTLLRVQIKVLATSVAQLERRKHRALLASLGGDVYASAVAPVLGEQTPASLAASAWGGAAVLGSGAESAATGLVYAACDMDVGQWAATKASSEDLRTRVQLFAAVAECVEALHSHGWAHNSVRPDAFWVTERAPTAAGDRPSFEVRTSVLAACERVGAAEDGDGAQWRTGDSGEVGEGEGGEEDEEMAALLIRDVGNPYVALDRAIEDPRQSDMWSVGLLGFVILSGQVQWVAVAAMRQMLQNADMRPWNAQWPAGKSGVVDDPRLTAILNLCTHCDPTERLSAPQLTKALHDWLRG
jgi:hypothetical protein